MIMITFVELLSLQFWESSGWTLPTPVFRS